MSDSNGHRNHFGDLPSQEVLPEVADRTLAIIRERHPYIFSAALAEALTGIRLIDTAPRARKATSKAGG